MTRELHTSSGGGGGGLKAVKMYAVRWVVLQYFPMALVLQKGLWAGIRVCLCCFVSAGWSSISSVLGGAELRFCHKGLVSVLVGTSGCMHRFRVGSKWGNTLLAHRQWGNAFPIGESGTVVPLLGGAATAPWCPSHAGIGMLHMNFSQW